MTNKTVKPLISFQPNPVVEDILYKGDVVGVIIKTPGDEYRLDFTGALDMKYDGEYFPTLVRAENAAIESITERITRA